MAVACLPPREPGVVRVALVYDFLQKVHYIMLVITVISCISITRTTTTTTTTTTTMHHHYYSVYVYVSPGAPETRRPTCTCPALGA